MLWSKGDSPDAVYFLTSGKVAYNIENRSFSQKMAIVPFSSFFQGTYFGEIDIYKHRKRHYHVNAIE